MKGDPPECRAQLRCKFLVYNFNSTIRRVQSVTRRPPTTLHCPINAAHISENVTVRRLSARASVGQ